MAELWKEHYFSPGPTPVPHRVLQAMAVPHLHHRTKVFEKELRTAIDGLRELLDAPNDPLLLTSSGTGAMEAVLLNVCAPGDSVLVVNAGSFGERWTGIAKTIGLVPAELKAEWGTTPPIDEILSHLRAGPKVRALLLQHSETSTGVLHPVSEIGRRVKEEFPEVLVVVDAISSIATLPISLSKDPIDVFVASAHKGLMLPPGLSIVYLSARAWKAAEALPPRSHYFDLRVERDWQKKNTTAWTPATTLVVGLNASLAMLREEGHENVYRRHAMLSEATRLGLSALGLDLLAEGCWAPGVTASYAPQGIEADALRELCLKRFETRLAGGQGKLKGKIFRIGHMGYTDRFDILAALGAVELALEALAPGQRKLGTAVSVALEVIASHEKAR